MQVFDLPLYTYVFLKDKKWHATFRPAFSRTLLGKHIKIFFYILECLESSKILYTNYINITKNNSLNSFISVFRTSPII